MTSTETSCNSVDSQGLRTWLFDYVCSLLTAGQELMREPTHYAPLRMVNASLRILDLAQRLGVSEPFYDVLARQLHESSAQCMANPERFLAGVEEAIMLCVNHAMTET